MTSVCQKIPHDNAVMNYVWINRDKYEGEGNDPVCGVPLHYLDKAFENARRYSHAPFLIWLDYNLLDGSSRLMVESHAYMNAPDNVTLCDLNDIPKYVENPLFSAGIQIWQRVDLARLIVLEHCLQMRNEKDVFYADFDTEDVKLYLSRANHSLARYGVFLGSTASDLFDLENGFIALRKGEGQRFLDSLISKTIESYEESGVQTGFSAYSYCVNKWINKYDICRSTILGERLKPMGHVMMPPEEYSMRCIRP